jgi:hypothetical protein
VFLDAEHPFKADPRLVEQQLPWRRLREKEPVFIVPEDFVPMNPDAYIKRYGHRLKGNEPPPEIIELRS